MIVGLPSLSFTGGCRHVVVLERKEVFTESRQQQNPTGGQKRPEGAVSAASETTGLRRRVPLCFGKLFVRTHARTVRLIAGGRRGLSNTRLGHTLRLIDGFTPACVVGIRSTANPARRPNFSLFVVASHAVGRQLVLRLALSLSLSLVDRSL